MQIAIILLPQLHVHAFQPVIYCACFSLLAGRHLLEVICDRLQAFLPDTCCLFTGGDQLNFLPRPLSKVDAHTLLPCDLWRVR